MFHSIASILKMDTWDSSYVLNLIPENQPVNGLNVRGLALNKACIYLGDNPLFC